MSGRAREASGMFGLSFISGANRFCDLNICQEWSGLVLKRFVIVKSASDSRSVTR